MSGVVYGDRIELNNLVDGKYLLDVTDVNYVNLTSKFVIKLADVDATLMFSDIQKRIYDKSGVRMYSEQEVINNGMSGNYGYIGIQDNVVINDDLYSLSGFSASDTCCFVIVERKENTGAIENKKWCSTSEYYSKQKICDSLSNLNLNVSSCIFSNTEFKDGSLRVYLWDAGENVYYDVYAGYKCDQSQSENNYKFIKVKTYNAIGVEMFDMYMGCKLLPYYIEKNNFSLSRLYGKWWENIEESHYEPKTKWAIKHFIVKQSINKKDTFNSRIYTINTDGSFSKYALFGQPERHNELFNTPVYSSFESCVTYPYNENGRFVGYEITDSFSNEPTITVSLGKTREHFSKMAIIGENILSEPINVLITPEQTIYDSVKGLNIFYTEGLNGYFSVGSGCIIKNVANSKIYNGVIASENNIIMFCNEDMTLFTNNLTIHPTFTYPVIWKPFYIDGTMCIFDGDMGQDGFVYILTSGKVFNGITFEGKFSGLTMSYNGQTSNASHNSITTNDLNDQNREVVYWGCAIGETHDSTLTGKFGSTVTEGAPSDYSEDENLNYFTKIKLESRNNYMNIEFPDSIVKIQDSPNSWYYLKPVDGYGNEHQLITDGNNNVKYYGVTFGHEINNYFSGNTFDSNVFDTCINDPTSASTCEVVSEFENYSDNDITDNIINGTELEPTEQYVRVICKVENMVSNENGDNKSSVIKVYTIKLIN
jgi:hypothetical protein